LIDFLLTAIAAILDLIPFDRSCGSLCSYKQQSKDTTLLLWAIVGLPQILPEQIVKKRKV
jgi:hypothetical protein